MKSVFALTAATFFWGLNFHLGKMMLSSVGFIEAGFWRYLFGVVVLGAMVFRRFPSFRSVRGNLKGISLVGLIGLFGFNLFFFWGLLHTSAVNAALIISLNPALTLLLSGVILKTELSGRAISGIILGLAGVVFLMLKGQISGFGEIRFGSGDVLIFIANILFSLHHVWVKKYSGWMPVVHFTFLTNFLCLLCFMLMLLFTGTGTVSTYPSLFWLSAVGIGCLGTALAYFLWNKGVQEMGADRAGIFMNVVPLTTAVLATVFGESLYFYHLTGGMMVLAGLFLTLKVKQKNQAPQSIAR